MERDSRSKLCKNCYSEVSGPALSQQVDDCTKGFPQPDWASSLGPVPAANYISAQRGSQPTSALGSSKNLEGKIERDVEEDISYPQPYSPRLFQHKAAAQL